MSLLTKTCNTRTITAGGTGDGTYANGVAINGEDYATATVTIAWSTVLTNKKTLALAVEVATSSDGVTWAEAQTIIDAVVATGTATDTVFSGSTSYALVLTSLLDINTGYYFRINTNLDLSATSVDTATQTTTLTLDTLRVVSAEEAVVAAIVAAGIVGLDSNNVFRGPINEVSERSAAQLGVFVAETGGADHFRFMGDDKDYSEVTVNVGIRSDAASGYAHGGDLAREVLQAVHCSTTTGYVFCVVDAPSPQFDGRESEQMYLWSFDARLGLVK